MIGCGQKGVALLTPTGLLSLPTGRIPPGALAPLFARRLDAARLPSLFAVLCSDGAKPGS